MMMRILQKWGAIHHGHARATFAQIGRSRIEALTGTSIRLLGTIAVFQNEIGSKVHVGCCRRPKGIYFASQELNGLGITAKLEIDQVSNGKAIEVRHGQRLQRSAMRDRVSGGKAPHGESDLRRPAVFILSPVGDADNSIRRSSAGITKISRQANDRRAKN